MPTITFRSPLEVLSIEGEIGSTILEAAQRAGAQVGHTCGGVCACSTCHVWVRRGFTSLPEPDDLELDRLEQAFDVRPHSRLACQATIQSEDLEIWITQESLAAFMDENPTIREELEKTGRWPLAGGVDTSISVP